MRDFITAALPCDVAGSGDGHGAERQGGRREKMRPNAIVYTSNTGYTAQYAALLGKKTALPVYSLSEAEEKLPAGNPVLYLGWLMASAVKGYQKAAKRYRICAVCGVGMGASGSQLGEVRKANAIPEAVPLFTLQGGFDITKLRGVYKLMMTVMVKTAGKGLADKPDRTAEEDVMLDMMLHGGNDVREENLEQVLDWLEKA